jgi:REP element-mobilizing transposase RayT
MECVFGSVASDGQVALSDWGHVVEACWRAIPDHFREVALNTCITMPNHLHGIVIVRARHASSLRTSPSFDAPTAIPRSLGVIVGSFKSAVTRRIREIAARPDETVWQRNYYEHIIRDDDDLQRIRRYIETNPIRWAERALRRS